MARYRYVRDATHPLATKNGTLPEHRKVLFDRIGEGPHRCRWCGTQVDWGDGTLRVDHLDGGGRNNTPANLVPSCHRCNTRRGDPRNLGSDTPSVRMKGNRGRHRAVRRVCEHCGEPFLHLAADKRPNRGRFCSRSCARRAPRH